MAEKPRTLFLIILATMGSAILSPLTIQGVPVIILVIPFALVATALHGSESGIMVGVVSSVLVGLLTHTIEGWGIAAYAIAAALTVGSMDTLVKGEKKEIHLLFFAAAGTILFEFLNDLYVGQNILLRPEHFLGTSPRAGIRVLANVFITGILANYWLEKTPAKK